MSNIKQKILDEMKINLEVNDKIGEKTIFFTSIIIAQKENKITPTFTTIADDELEEKTSDFDVDYAQFNRAKREFSDAIIEILKNKLKTED